MEHDDTETFSENLFAREVALHPKCLSLVDQDMVGKTIVAIFHALSLLLQPEKKRNN